MGTVRRSRYTASGLALAAVAAAGWLAWLGWAHAGDTPLAWTDLTERTLGEPQRSQLMSFAAREGLRDALGGSATLPPIDFGSRTAILVAAGPRSSSAYGLDVLGISEENRRVVVTVHERTPTLAAPGAARLAFPFRLITIERTDKPIVLHWEGRP
jgi:hypothetical protein